MASWKHAKDGALTASIHDLIKLERIIMARIDELESTVAHLKDSTERALAEIAALKDSLVAAAIEDPRIGQAIDALNTVKTAIDAIVPPTSIDAAPTP